MPAVQFNDLKPNSCLFSGAVKTYLAKPLLVAVKEYNIIVGMFKKMFKNPASVS